MSLTAQGDRAGIISLLLWPAYICFLLIFMKKNEWRLQKFLMGRKEKRNKSGSNIKIQRVAPTRAAPAPELVAVLLGHHPYGSWGLQGT